MTPTLHEILYCSVLAPDQAVTTVGQIIGKARHRNQEDEVTGLLVFDGWRFCQHLEGPRDAVIALMDRIARDPRHTDIRVVYEGLLAQRHYHRFDMGYATSEGEEDLAEVHQLDGDAAMQRFLALRPGFDVNG